MDFKRVKIVVFTPLSHCDQVREVLSKAGAGHIGNYDSCSFSSKGTGRFQPLKGSNPYLGSEGKMEEVEEERIEVICPSGLLKEVLWALRKAHPYEHPAIDIYPLLND